MLYREGLDILVHPETGDDVADHTLHSLWLGEKLELNVEVLRQANSQHQRVSSRSVKSSSSFVITDRKKCPHSVGATRKL